MEDVVEKLESTLISNDPKPGTKSNYEDLYKNWGKLDNQEERRKEILEVQKCNRNEKLDKYRGILELVNAVEQGYLFRPSNRAYYRPSIYVAGFHKASPTYSNVLMLSEWMIEKPEDFSENWYVVPCPKGLRTLVVASHGRTQFFTRYGHKKFECKTCLPGGSRSDPKHNSRVCVLDGFYVEKTKTMYIVDVLAWNNQPMTDGEFEFRHYWIDTQLNEANNVRTINKKNEVAFIVLPKVSCEKEPFDKFMNIYPYFTDETTLDGLLFYHKKTHYTSGQTPLVGWLFPFMIPEVFGQDVTVNEEYMKKKPKDYTNQADYIRTFDDKYSKKNPTHRKRCDSKNKMDTAENTNESSEVKQENLTETLEVMEESSDQGNETMDSEAAEQNSPKMESEVNEKAGGDTKTDNSKTDEKVENIEE